jgi:hypothetical protein
MFKCKRSSITKGLLLVPTVILEEEEDNELFGNDTPLISRECSRKFHINPLDLSVFSSNNLSTTEACPKKIILSKLQT